MNFNNKPESFNNETNNNNIVENNETNEDSTADADENKSGYEEIDHTADADEEEKSGYDEENHTADENKEQIEFIFNIRELLNILQNPDEFSDELSDVFEEKFNNHVQDIDVSIFEDKIVEEDNIFESTNIKINTSSLLKLIKRAGITNISNNAVEFLSTIIYNKLSKILQQALIVKDQRDVKILNIIDIISVLQMTENIIFPTNLYDCKSKN
jgi:hypothetical protein